VALASAGAVASASSTFSSGYPVSAVNDDERAGVNPGIGENRIPALQKWQVWFLHVTHQSHDGCSAEIAAIGVTSLLVTILA
jgi:hypothetical protein